MMVAEYNCGEVEQCYELNDFPELASAALELVVVDEAVKLEPLDGLFSHGPLNFRWLGTW
jgi:hypothetical protein